MGYCRVDTDLLRGLASQLGAAAMAIADAGPAVALLEAHGFGSTAEVVAARFAVTTDWLQQWELSLLTRADLVEAERDFFATATIASPSMIQSAADRAALASLVPDPSHLRTAVTEWSTLEARFLANRSRIEAARIDARSALARAVGWDRIVHFHEVTILDQLAAQNRTYLEFDWQRGRIVEWIGPPDARHVAVYVPGAGISRLDFPRLAERIGVLVELDPTDGDLAVIVALASDTPPTVAHAALGHYADAGGAELVEALARLDLTAVDRDGRHVTLIGHSYGSVVVGEALRRGVTSHLPVDYDIVALGSPGMRADHVSDFDIDPDRFWVARLPGDAIAYAVHPSELPRLVTCATTGVAGILEWCRPGPELMHGLDPTDRSFGGQVFAGASSRAGLDAHTDYLATQTHGGVIVPSLALGELIRIVVGRPPEGE